MTLRESVSFMSIVVLTLTLVLAVTLVARTIPFQIEEPACRWVETRVIPAGFMMFRGGVRVERAAYEVNILKCPNGEVAVRK